MINPKRVPGAELLTLLLIVASRAGAGTCCWPPSSLPGLVEDPGTPREDIKKTRSLFFQEQRQ